MQHKFRPSRRRLPGASDNAVDRKAAPKRSPPKSSAKRRASWRRYRERKKPGGWGQRFVGVLIDLEFIEELIERKRLAPAHRRDWDKIAKLFRRLLQEEWATYDRAEK
ncbi:MAG: hypothetical protein ACOY3N_23985 [Bradyrhizobium sp.]|uniref:hypothetical protein n=1 Tax=Bradyrhizobium sp. TaxID=376 RepID=UPI003BF2CF8D